MGDRGIIRSTAPLRHRLRQHDNGQGALWILASALCFTIMTAIVKYLSPHYSAALQTFYGQAAALLIASPFILRDPLGVLRTPSVPTMLRRTLVGTGGTLLTYYSFQQLPLAMANALSFTRALWVVPIVIVVLHETVGRARIIASLVGFGGIVVMLGPTSTGTGIGAPYGAALLAAVLLALSLAFTKVMARDHRPITILTYSMLAAILVSFPLALPTWRVPTWSEALLLLAVGACTAGGQACYIRGMAIGEPSAVVPVDYLRLPLAVVAGYLVFGELASPRMLLGAGIIIGSTLYIALRTQPRTPATADIQNPL